ncbi:protein of unknown function [Candidatus Hydrogenisulfobacillus filiaventi]|uniref:Uncharacterized protein n=1 Tax=Candidatus Hydrogenisulfobacillus filiaventi TaxID=2707344 RepID=A0A6F8ZKT4_9FIRM|nr:protein of unknown function [Candidatus Hydrogenisulfobacillus filiaventi]
MGPAGRRAIRGTAVGRRTPDGRPGTAQVCAQGRSLGHAHGPLFYNVSSSNVRSVIRQQGVVKQGTAGVPAPAGAGRGPDLNRQAKGGRPVTPGSGNYIVEGLFLLTFIVGLILQARHKV